jgi:Fic family protein
MMSFQSDKLANKMSWPNETLHFLGRIHEYRGRQDSLKRQFPKIINVLQDTAIIHGTKSSNRIEGIVIETQYLTSIMNNKIQPKTRSELEVVGYLNALAKIYTFADITTEPYLLIQLYKDLVQDASDSGDCIRKNDILITLKSPDGSKYSRLIKTAVAMDWLFNAYRNEKEHGSIDNLILIATFVLDFICIDLFFDGDGRITRLLTLLLLYQNGHEVGRFISLEKIIEETKHEYYEALQQSSRGWHEGEHNLIPWLNYFLEVLLKAYERFSDRVGQASSGVQRWSSKVLNVQEIIDDFITDFTVQDIKQRCPGVSQTTIQRILNHHDQNGTIKCLEHGKWIKLKPISVR